MGLRLRLGLALAAVAIPLVAAMTWGRGELDRRSELRALEQLIEGRLQAGREGPPMGPPPGRGRPDGAPPGPVIHLFHYGADFAPDAPHAPTFPATLRRALEGGAERASEAFQERGRSGVRVAVRDASGGGPEGYVMAERTGAGPSWILRNQLLTACALALALALAACVAVGPLVQRVKRLQREVSASLTNGYATPVAETGNDELTMFAREFNRARDTAHRQVKAVRESERALRAFVANTSHDMMIPMTVLQGHLSALRDGRVAEPREGLRAAMEEVQYMTALLQNLSVTAQLEAGDQDLERRPVDLGALLQRVVARHAPIAAANAVELNFATPDGPVHAQGDLTLIEQAVSNLVQNAVRYVPRGGHVAVLLDGLADGGWRLRVIDDGPGIEPAQIERLMERAARGDQARSRHPQGQGLGLHIVHAVALRHGFALELGRSEYGGLEVSLASPKPAPTASC